MDVQQMRNEMRARRDQLSPEKRQTASQAIARHICQSHPWKKAETVALFYPFGSEVSTFPLIEAAWAAHKTVLLPVCQPAFQLIFSLFKADTPLVQTALGVQEIAPDHIAAVDNRQIDFCLVPGLIFDPFGGRIGYGAGYYDRFLPTLRPDCFIVGCCFSEQVRSDAPLPLTPTDIRLPQLVTEEGFYRF